MGHAGDPFLENLLVRLSSAVGAAELEQATRPPDGIGIHRRVDRGDVRVGGRLFAATVPRISITLEPAVDAGALCEAWGLARPIAVAVDVHQSRWAVVVAGDELPDPFSRRIATHPIGGGRWEVRPLLAARPPGPLPDVVAGASPAYDVRASGGDVRVIQIDAPPVRADVVGADHPDARQLLDAMARAYPAWRLGWQVTGDADVVVVYEGDEPAGAAVLTVDDDGVAGATRLAVSPDRRTKAIGSVLLDVVEAVALDRGANRVRLDGSAFLHALQIPYDRHGYVVGPPYDGDADGPVWAERDLSREGLGSR